MIQPPIATQFHPHTGIAEDAAAMLGTDDDDVLLGGPDNEVIAGVAGNDTLYGGQGNDDLDGGQGDDQLYGQDGDDVLSGGPGADMLCGGTGHNLLRGGAGTDIYRVGAAASRDVIDNAAAGGTLHDADKILFASAISPAQVWLRRAGDDLRIRMPQTASTTEVMGYFADDAGTPHAVSYLEFDDGTTWDVAAVKAMLLRGSATDDHLIGYAGIDRLDGHDGNDLLEGRGGRDLLLGGDGDDLLDGGQGRDALVGGPGNDRLVGGAGSDRYFFERGGGHDVIVSAGSMPGEADQVHLGEDIDQDQVWFQRAGDDLVISIIGTTDRIDIQHWFTGAAAGFAGIELANEKSITPARIDALVAAMANMVAPSVAGGQPTGPAQARLAELIAASWIGEQAS